MSFLDELKELKALHDGGDLTDEEFSAAKAKLLDRPGESAEPNVVQGAEPEGVSDDDEAERDADTLREEMHALFFDDDTSKIVVAQDGSGDCTDLAAAIEAAPAGATIKVHKGVYVGPFVIDKDLVIQGEQGVRVRPELPAEMGLRLAAELEAADEALDVYLAWAMPELMLKQLEFNVRFNPIKRVKMNLLEKELKSDERKAQWQPHAQVLEALDAALWGGFVTIEDAHVTIEDIVFGFDDDEAASFVDARALLAVPSNMHRDTTNTATYDKDLGARRPWVSMGHAKEWAEQNGFDEEDVYGTAAQHREREARTGTREGSSDHENPLCQWGWWAELGGRLFDVVDRGSRDGMRRLARLRDGKTPEWGKPMLSFHASAAAHGLVLKGCAFVGHGMFTEGVRAESDDAGAELRLLDSGILGIRSAHEFKPKESLWLYDNAAVSITWPETEEGGRITLDGCPFEGGFVGIDLKGGRAEITGCATVNNTAIGVRVYGNADHPNRAFATMDKCTVKHQAFSGVLGFRLDSDTMNFTCDNLTSEDCGQWPTGALKSAALHAEEKRHAAEEKKRKAAEVARKKEAAARKAAADARRKEAAREAAREAAARKAAASQRQLAQAAITQAKALAKKTNKPTPHPDHAHVLIQPSGKLAPASGYAWASSVAGDFRVKKKAPPKPTGDKLVQNIGNCDIRCEMPECAGPIRGKLYHFNGKMFRDGWHRGWFCSKACLNEAESRGFFGIPHPDFKRGDTIAVMDDGSNLGLTLINEAMGYDDLYDPHTRMRVISNQYWLQDYGGEAGKDGQVSLSTVMAVSVECNGRQYDQQYVGWFYFVSR